MGTRAALVAVLKETRDCDPAVPCDGQRSWVSSLFLHGVQSFRSRCLSERIGNMLGDAAADAIASMLLLMAALEAARASVLRLRSEARRMEV